MVEPFEVLTLAQLRERRSIKWRQHAPDVLPLWIAEMDALPPQSVAEALVADLLVGDTGYPPLDHAYAEALADVAAARWGWQLDVEGTTVCADVLTGITRSLELFTQPGETVLVPAPVYMPLLFLPAEMGRRVQQVPMTAEGRLDLDALGAAMADPSATALILCSPHNPLGTVHTADELRAVAALAQEHGVGVIVDEIHSLLVPAGTEFTPYLAVNGTGLVVTSASKVYNMAGIKAGVVVAGPGSRDTLAQLPESVKYGASTIGIRAHVAAWRGGDEWLDAVNANIASNAAYLADLLADRLPAVGYTPPASTYLAWLDCRALGLGDDPAAAFLERGRVALNGGLPFGIGGEGHVRLNLAASRSTLAEAVERMARTVGA